jgi:hypothetical protein
VFAESETPVVSEPSKVAVSEGPFGTAAGVQFAAVFQLPELGFVVQVALPARADAALKIKQQNLSPRTGEMCIVVGMRSPISCSE